MIFECDREQEIVDAVASARWPDRCDDTLRAHVATCTACADLVEVLGPIAEDRDIAWEAAAVPPASVVWWRARIRARDAALRSAARPLNLIYAIALVFFGAVAGGLLVTLWSRVREAAAALAGRVQPPTAADVAAAFTPIAGSPLILVALGTSLLIAPLAIWLVLRADQ